MRPSESGDVNSGGMRPSNQASGADPDGEHVEEAMTNHGRIDALIDGRVTGPERDELLAKLLADDDAYRLFAETVGVLHDIEAEHAGSVPSPVLDLEPPAVDPAVDAAPDRPPPAAPDESDEPAEGVIPLASRRPAAEPVVTEAPAADPVVVDAPVSHDGVAGDGVIALDSRRRGSLRWIGYGAIAAGIMGIALTAALLKNRPPALLDDPTRAVAMLEDRATPGLAEGWNAAWGNTRGQQTPTYEGAAVHIGANLVDLELAAATNDTAALHALAGETRALLDEIPGGGRIVRTYRAVADSSGTAEQTKARLAAGRDYVRELMAPSAEWLELGVWGETARTAAVRRDAKFFRTSATRAAIERADAIMQPGSQEQRALAAVKEVLPADGRTTDWVALEKNLSTLLRTASRRP